MSDMHLHGSAFYDFLKLRKQFFVDGLSWDVPNDGIVEMDQYDTPLAHYSVVELDGRIVAGARTQTTGTEWGAYSCMLKDAALGKLDGIPSHIFDPDVCAPDVWECTRLVVSDEIQSVDQRLQCIALSIDGLIRTILANGGRKMISFSPPSLQRTFRMIGVEAERISMPYTCESDGRNYAVFKAFVVRPVERLRRLGIDPVRNEVPSTPFSRAV